VSQERPEEWFAFAVVGSVLPVTVEPYDRCGRILDGEFNPQ
jgi:hypothetical protein